MNSETYSDHESAMPSPLWQVEDSSLGEALMKARQEQNLMVPRAASLLGVPPDRFRAWLADAQLPTADEVSPLCDFLGLNPTRVLRLIAETARRNLTELVDRTRGVQAMSAKRQSGAPASPDDHAIFANIPPALRRLIAEVAEIADTDVAGVVGYVRRLGQTQEQRRVRLIQSLVAGLVLDGDET